MNQLILNKIKKNSLSLSVMCCMWGGWRHILFVIQSFYYLQQNENLQTVKQICIRALASSGLTQQLAEFLQSTNCKKIGISLYTQYFDWLFLKGQINNFCTSTNFLTTIRIAGVRFLKGTTTKE